MHIPDGFLDGKTAAVTAAFSAAGVGLALRQVRRELPPRKVPLLGLAAAFLFAAQMVNFPVAGGTSGHLVGGVLVAALLGPGAAIVVVTTVLIVQCFLFADGGVLALGANVFNMGIVGGGAGGILYRFVCAWIPGIRGRVTAIVFAGWCSTVLASICCAGQLAWSGTVPWPATFTAMVSVHMLIGIGEGVISALALLAIYRTRPEMIPGGDALQRVQADLQVGPTGSMESLGPPDCTTAGRAGCWSEFMRYGLLAALGVAIFVAPFACPWPDGLKAVASKLGFEHKTVHAVVPAAALDYRVPGVHWAVGATALAGAAGTLMVFGLGLLLGRVLVPRSAEET